MTTISLTAAQSSSPLVFARHGAPGAAVPGIRASSKQSPGYRQTRMRAWRDGGRGRARDLSFEVWSGLVTVLRA